MEKHLPTPIPRHVAIIMDGNGRWARARGLPRLKGHEAGAESVRRVLRAARKYGVKYVTLYAFSVENWSRPAIEVRGLMRLLRTFLKANESELHENRTRLRVMGRRSDLPAATDRELARIEAATACYDERQLVLCLSYGGRTEIAAAARKIAEEAAAGRLDPAAVDETAVASRLYLPDVPDPDLVVRTSGERRLSNFLLWQCAYAEFLSTPVAWPDFGEDDFRAALEEFSRRHRRFGGLGPDAGPSA
ncbi:MAG: di-trans,poly-cis-decaprenylcistransferase [Kiritimatiellae bacterium]|nr:di-trans,poly-cis-decaprenylcistransferase [Kiritimatiellia bacterium]